MKPTIPQTLQITFHSMSRSHGVAIRIPTTFIWINHNIKANDRQFIKLTKCFQTRRALNPACLAQTFMFLLASIEAILFKRKLPEFTNLGRIVKRLYLLSLLFNKQITIILHFTLSKMSVK